MKLLRSSLILFWLNLQAKFAVPTSTWQAVRPPTSPCAVSPLRLRLSRKHIEVAWLWWLIPRQLHKHIEVYTNTTQPMHITMCSFWTPFKVIEKTQNYTKTNTQMCFSLASPHKHPLTKYVSQIQVHTDANEAIGASPIPATDLDHSENNVSDIYTHMIDHWSDTFSFILKVSLNIICRLWLPALDLDTRDSTWPTFRTPAKTIAKNTQRERQI